MWTLSWCFTPKQTHKLFHSHVNFSKGITKKEGSGFEHGGQPGLLVWNAIDWWPGPCAPHLSPKVSWIWLQLSHNPQQTISTANKRMNFKRIQDLTFSWGFHDLSTCDWLKLHQAASWAAVQDFVACDGTVSLSVSSHSDQFISLLSLSVQWTQTHLQNTSISVQFLQGRNDEWAALHLKLVTNTWYKNILRNKKKTSDSDIVFNET